MPEDATTTKPADEKPVEPTPVDAAEEPAKAEGATDVSAETTDEVAHEDDAEATDAAEGEAAPDGEVGSEEAAPVGAVEEEYEDDDDEFNDMTPEELEEARANEVAFSWQASEYVHHHKGIGWYAALAGVVGVLVIGAALLRFWLEVGAFLVMAAAIIVYARKPPRTLLYELTPKGITIEGKAYPFAEFRSFGVFEDDEWHSIDLEPTKRFSPRITVLFETADLDDIVGHLELHLPRTDREPDLIERATRYLRF